MFIWFMTIIGPSQVYPACLRTAADLMEADLEYVFVETDFAKSYRDQLKAKYDWPTFPIIVRRTQRTDLVVGGYDQLKEYLKKPESIL